MSALRRYKGIVAPEIGPKSLGTFEKQAPEPSVGNYSWAPTRTGARASEPLIVRLCAKFYSLLGPFGIFSKFFRDEKSVY